MIFDDSTLRGVREVLLHHPLAQPTDARIVAASELYTVLKGVLDSLRDLEEQPSAQREAAGSIVDDACMKIDKWHGDWDSMLSAYGARFTARLIGCNSPQGRKAPYRTSFCKRSGCNASLHT